MLQIYQASLSILNTEELFKELLFLTYKIRSETPNNQLLHKGEVLMGELTHRISKDSPQLKNNLCLLHQDLMHKLQSIS